MSDCIDCQKNSTHSYHWYAGTCHSDWPSGFYGTDYNTDWVPCHQYCTKWYGAKSIEWFEWDTVNGFYYATPNTCQYVYCPNGTYYNTTFKAWRNCDSECATCYGPSNTEWKTCPYERILVNGNSCKLCEEISSYNYYDANTNTCKEQWGKGLNLGGLEWDDGNTLGGDGWSSDCMIEYGFTCTQGDQSTYSSCKSLNGPVCQITKQLHQDSLIVSCTETVQFYDINPGDINVTIDGPLAPYQFDFEVGESTGFVSGTQSKTFKIKINLKSSLYGNEQGNNSW